MNSYPDFGQVCEGLGDKVIEGLSRAVAAAKEDLTTYRQQLPALAGAHTARGLANWVHDQLWRHLVALLDDVEGVYMANGEPKREFTVGGRYRVRVKKHDEQGKIATIETQGALRFMEQDTAQLSIEGMGETRLMAGYTWDKDLREVGEAVISLRDGRNNVIWIEPLPVDGVGVQTVRPVDGPIEPEVDVPGAAERRESEEQ